MMHLIQTNTKGIHPGLFLAHELNKRHLLKGPFSKSINEYPQTIGSITKGKRSMNTRLALKIENALGLEEGTLMTMQVFYDIRELKKKQDKAHPEIKKFRPVLFWDTNMDRIDWVRQKTAIISRVFERGNEAEKEEITRFYGKEIVDQILEKNAGKSLL